MLPLASAVYVIVVRPSVRLSKSVFIETAKHCKPIM